MLKDKLNIIVEHFTENNIMEVLYDSYIDSEVKAVLSYFLFISE